MNDGNPVHCRYDAMVPLSELKPHPRNPNTHPKRQLELLSDILRKQGWRAPVVVSNRSGFIVAGHARRLAAEIAGFDIAPVNYQDFDSDEREIEHLLADNRIAELSETSDAALRDIIENFPDLDSSLAGYDAEDFERLLEKDRAEDTARRIKAEEEQRRNSNPDPAAIIASLTGHVERLATTHPERLRQAFAVVVPLGRGQTRDCLILVDPATSDAAAELRRLAELGHESPIAGLLAALLPMDQE